MSRYAGVLWDPSPNFRPGPTKKVRVVLHRMAGSYAGGLSWLKDPSSRVSANFTVDNVSGEGRQLVDTADVAWAQAAYNPSSISIEIGGFPPDPVSDAAWTTVASIVRQADVLDGVPLALAVVAADPGLSYHALLGGEGGGHFDCPGALVVAARPMILARASGTAQKGWWPLMGLFRDDNDEARAFVRWCYLSFLYREPESEAKMAEWVAFLQAQGADATLAAIAASAEGQAWLAKHRGELAAAKPG